MRNFPIRILLLGFLVLPGCAILNKEKPAQPAPLEKPSHVRPKSTHSETRSAPKPAADPQAQQRLYDLGMKNYTQENYTEAKKAWQQAIQLGPKSALADKARENLKKADQILKTLQEMEKK